MWTHNAGNPEELAAIEGIVDSYNKSADAKAKIKVQAFPQDSYNDSVVSAAASGKLPCIVDIDGPNVPNWAWAKYLTPLKLDCGCFQEPAQHGGQVGGRDLRGGHL